jgi:23S rRNA pseudouridine1911/1915/1917 synthase
MRTDRVEHKKEKQVSLHVREPMELMTFLSIHFNGKSRTAFKSMLSQKQIRVNGKSVSQYDHLLQPNDSVTIHTEKHEFRHPKMKLVFEDDFLIVIDKSEGLLAVATDERKDELTAFSILSNYLKKKDTRNHLFVVHRIDRETSGLLMFAKSKEIQLDLQNNWHENVIERFYIAVVEGIPDKQEDTLVSYLRESKAFKVHSESTEDRGKKAITHYRLIRKNDDYSMLKVELETGRKNQIRVHMQEIGHPIIGDKKYGASTSPIGRMGLHACVLSFVHPVSHRVMRFETPIPKKFNALFSSRK